ncbi:MAG: type II/IV secretion system protein [Phycisphaerae bacterium]|nr:type II/IV secretion system protein [Phycisphaerae bacterium]
MAPTDISAGEGIVRTVDELLARAITRRASDIHVEPSESGLLIRYRLDGLLQDVDRLPAHLADNVIARLKVLAGLLTYRKDIPQEGAFRAGNGSRETTPGIDVRVATFPTVCGERAALRLMYAVGQVSGLDDLGLPPTLLARLRRAAEQPQGMILVTGPAGSGKSTTLYALARHIRTVTPGRSVITLEDPVEQRLPGVAQIQVQPHGELDYVRAMRSLLRQDVQVLLVGEIRDAETAHIVVEAALTGHLIVSTLHSGDPAEAVVRLLEMGIAPYQVAGALTLVCTQRLLRTLCPTCRGQGTCDVCLGSGYLGRTACGQVAEINDRLRQAILDRRPVGELRQLIKASGPDLAADARRLVDNGRTTLDEVRRVLGTLDGDQQEDV